MRYLIEWGLQMYFGENRDDTASSRTGKSRETAKERIRGSLLDLQSLIDRLFIDLV